MPTLEQAASQLGIAEKTLRRWLRLVDPPIEPTRDKRNLRYRFITEEEVERIRTARATITDLTTGSYGPPPPHDRLSYGKLDDDRRPWPENPSTDPSPVRGSRTVRSSIASDSLPDGLVSRSDAAAKHRIALTTVRRWCENGQVETDGGMYASEHGHFSVARPITTRGMRQLYQLAHRRTDFLPCPDCPHEEG